MAKAPDKIPTEPAAFLQYVLVEVWGGSPAALARAASVSRSAVNKWLENPPAELNTHIEKALEFELAAIQDRFVKVAIIQTAASKRADEMRREALRIYSKLRERK